MDKALTIAVMHIYTFARILFTEIVIESIILQLGMKSFNAFAATPLSKISPLTLSLHLSAMGFCSFRRFLNFPRVFFVLPN